MSATRTALARWCLVMVSGWLMSCGASRSTLHKEPVLPPDFSLAIEKVVQGFSQHESIWPETVPDAPIFAHKVKWSRETLFSIAHWYTGSGENWKQLAAINPNIKPNQIHIGDIIQIPEDLLKRRKAMPSDFLKPKTSPKRTSAPQTPTPSINADETTLYGPIGNDAPPPDTKKNDLPVPLETID